MPELPGPAGADVTPWVPGAVPPAWGVAWAIVWASVFAKELPAAGVPVAALCPPCSPPAACGGGGELWIGVTGDMALCSLVFDQDGSDRWLDIVPLATAIQFCRRIVTTVVAFNDPMLPQHRLAISKANGLRVAADGLSKQATRAAVTVFIMFSAVHCGNIKPPASSS